MHLTKLLTIFLSVLLSISYTCCGQAHILGSTNVHTGATEDYQVQFDQTPGPYAAIVWSVSGGTIISENNDNYCTVQWNNMAGTGSITVNENFSPPNDGNFYVDDGSYWQSDSRVVSISQSSDQCLQADAGPDKSVCTFGESVQIGTLAIPGYIYSWYPIFGLSNPNIAQPIVTPFQTTTYTLIVTPPSLQNNLIQNGDFESGFVNFFTDYGTFPNGNCAQGSPFGSIAVGTAPQLYQPIWCDRQDHTSRSGNMLIVDGACTANKKIWYQTITVNPNTTYYFSGWAGSNDNSNISNTPSIRVRINGADILQNFLVPYQALLCAQWDQFSASWNSGSATTALIEIYDDNLHTENNDFSLDDIYFATCPPLVDQVVVTTGSCGSCPTITPAGPIEKCVFFEAGNWLTLTTDFTSNIQWYENGIAIPGETSPTLNVPYPKLGGYPTLYSDITVKNTVTNCLSSPTRIVRRNWEAPDVYLHYESEGTQTPTSYCKNTIGIVRQLASHTGNVNYWWQVLDPNGNPASGVTIGSNYSINAYYGSVQADISFAGYGYSTATILAWATDNGCTNSYSYPVTINFGCRGINNITDPNKITIFPNPATSQTTITSNYIIESVEISNTFNPVLLNKKGNGSKTVTVNISSLSRGVYNCKVITKQGVIMEKLLIE